MRAAYYTREIAVGGILIKGAKPYDSINDALQEIIGHMRQGGIIKGWIEDHNGHRVVLPGQVEAILEQDFRL